MNRKLITNLQEIKKGDLVEGNNYTHSQKYLEYYGYEEYNETRTGIVVSEKHDTFFDIIILNENNEQVQLVHDPGSSGGWSVHKLF